VTPQGVTIASQGPKSVGWAFGASLAVHGLALAAIVWGWGNSPVPVGVPIMDVELVVAAPGESGSGAGEPAPASTPTAPAGTAPTPSDVGSAANEPPAPPPVASAEAAPAPELEPPITSAATPTLSSDKREASSPTEKGGATTDIPIILPDPEPLPPVQSEDVLRQPMPMPTTEAPAAKAPPLSPKASTPVQLPPAAPPRTASPTRPAPPPAPKRTQQDAASAPAPITQTPRGGGTTQGPEATGGGPAASGARLVRHVAPVYPALARERGLEGRVVVRLLIGVDGAPAEIRIAQSSGFESLDAAAIEAVRQWRFEPARRAGISVAEERLAPVVFRLRR
jgi:protein TonB